MYGLRLVTALETPAPLDPATVKKHLRVRHAEEDTYLRELVLAALAAAELATHRQLLTATWELVLDGFPEAGVPILLPLGTWQATTQIDYTNSTGGTTIWDAAKYTTAGTREPAEVTPAYGQSWPSARRVPAAVRVQWRCGYGGGEANLPTLLKHGLLMLVGHWYQNREAVVTGTIATELPLGVRHIFEQFRLGDDFDSYEPCGSAN